MNKNGCEGDCSICSFFERGCDYIEGYCTFVDEPTEEIVE
jgi:hypothetical protein